MDILYSLCNVLQRTTLRAFGTWKVTGRENVPSTGRLMVVANHQSNIDPPLLGACVPRRIRFLAKDTMFRTPLGHWFLKTYGAFPLKRDGVDVRAYRWSLEWLENDGALALFPEGTRSKSGMIEASIGVARLALRTGTPLLPVGIVGTERIGSWARIFNPTGRITVNIGEPFSLSPVAGKADKQVLKSMTDTIMRRIAALLPEDRRGVYGLNSAVATAGRGPAK